MQRLNLILDPAQIRKVSPVPESPADMFGNLRGEEVLPGPFAVWNEN